MTHKPYTREDVEQMKASGLSESVWGRVAATVAEIEDLRARLALLPVDEAAEARFEQLLNRKPRC